MTQAPWKGPRGLSWIAECHGKEMSEARQVGAGGRQSRQPRVALRPFLTATKGFSTPPYQRHWVRWSRERISRTHRSEQAVGSDRARRESISPGGRPEDVGQGAHRVRLTVAR